MNYELLKNKLLVLEGGEERSKTSVGRLLTDDLNNNGIETIFSFQPGDPAWGVLAPTIRSLIKDKRFDLNQRSIMFALLLDRSEAIQKIISPALREGKTVVLDRYGASTAAYQIYGANLKEELGMTDEIIDWLTYGCLNIKPDMVFYFPDKVGNRKNDPNDRFDNASSSYMQRVIAAYDMLAEKEGWYLAHAGNNAYETLQNLYKSVENKL